MTRNDNRPTWRIPTVKDCRTLLLTSHDREMLLAWKLGFHYGVNSKEAGRLCVEHICFDARNLPIGFYTTLSARDSAAAWYVPIRPMDRLLFKALLPQQGTLFLSKDPYRRLILLARQKGIKLARRHFREACVAYASASGLFHEKSLELAKFYARPFGPNAFSGISRAKAQEFWSLTVPSGKAAKRPRLRRIRRGY